MSALVHLQIEGCVPPPSNVTLSRPPSENLRTLPHLSLLSLTGLAIACANFANHLIVPTSASIYLGFTDVSKSNITSFINDSFMSKWDSRKTKKHPRTLQISSDSEASRGYWRTKYSIDLWFEVHPTHNLREVHPDFRVSIEGSLPSTNALKTLCNFFPLQEVVSLSIDNCVSRYDLIAPTLLTLIPTMPYIRNLRFAEGNHRHVAPFLRLTELPIVVLPLACLASITLKNIAFRGEGADSELLKDLVKFLQFRREVGGAVDQVIIQTCMQLHSEDIQQLREVVNVVWDGYESGKPKPGDRCRHCGH